MPTINELLFIFEKHGTGLCRKRKVVIYEAFGGMDWFEFVRYYACNSIKRGMMS